MALKSSLQATTTATVTVALKPTTRTMIKARAEEHARLAKTIREATARQKRIRTEVEELFVKDKQGRALADGTELDGFRFKMVTGSTKKLNRDVLIELGCDPDWIAEATEETPSTPYVKISAPGEKET